MLYEIGALHDDHKTLLIGEPGLDIQKLEQEFNMIPLNPKTACFFVRWLVKAKGFKRPTITTHFYG